MGGGFKNVQFLKLCHIFPMTLTLLTVPSYIFFFNLFVCSKFLFCVIGSSDFSSSKLIKATSK